jgi:hypothetical protein
MLVLSRGVVMIRGNQCIVTVTAEMIG